MSETKFIFLSKKLEELDKFTKHFVDYVQNKEPEIKRQITNSYSSMPDISAEEIEQNTKGRLMIERFYYFEYLFNMWGHYFDDVTYNEIKQTRSQLHNQWQLFSTVNKNRKTADTETASLTSIINSMNESNNKLNDYVINQKRKIVKEMEECEVCRV